MKHFDLIYPIWAGLNRGKYRLYRPHNYRVYLNVSESPMMAGRALGWYERSKFESLKAFLRPGMTFVDVGANKGDFALFAGHIVGPTGHVIAIEPEPSNCKWMRESISANGLSNIDVYKVALSDANGHADLHLGAKSGFHSLVTDGPTTIQVATARLDSLVGCLHIDAIKIDVEGAEAAVLSGMTEILHRDRPRLWIETHPQYGVDVNGVRQLLESYSYTVTAMNNDFYARSNGEVK